MNNQWINASNPTQIFSARDMPNSEDNAVTLQMEECLTQHQSQWTPQSELDAIRRYQRRQHPSCCTCTPSELSQGWQLQWSLFFCSPCTSIKYIGFWWQQWGGQICTMPQMQIGWQWSSPCCRCTKNLGRRQSCKEEDTLQGKQDVKCLLFLHWWWCLCNFWIMKTN